LKKFGEERVPGKTRPGQLRNQGQKKKGHNQPPVNKKKSKRTAPGGKSRSGVEKGGTRGGQFEGRLYQGRVSKKFESCKKKAQEPRPGMINGEEGKKRLLKANSHEGVLKTYMKRLRLETHQVKERERVKSQKNIKKRPGGRKERKLRGSTFS